MTYRELLKLYKQGKLEDSTKKQIEAEIEKQDAISEFLYEEGAIYSVRHCTGNRNSIRSRH